MFNTFTGPMAIGVATSQDWFTNLFGMIELIGSCAPTNTHIGKFYIAFFGKKIHYCFLSFFLT